MGDAGGKTRYRIRPPVQQLPELLPLYDPNFPWSRFEAFCRALIAQMPTVQTVTHYGKAGDAQRGIDLVATLDDGSKWVFQCRQRKKVNRTQFEKAVKDTTYQADRYFYVVSCEAGAQVRDAAEKVPNWDVWDIRDVSHQVRELPLDSGRRLVERHFGLSWGKAFLGIRAPEAFVSSKTFFLRFMDRRNLFNHAWTLIGRTEILKELQAFAKSKRAAIAVLQGRGGIGKSKVLKAFAEGKHGRVAIKFLLEGMPLTPETLEDAPEGACIVIVDDAHRREDLGPLLAWARAGRERKLLLSARPYGADRMSALLSQSGFDTREVTWLEQIKELELEEVVSLAELALGKKYSSLAPQLARVTADCPLVTVVGGQLLAARQLAPELLESDAEFRDAVLTRFRDVLVGRLSELIEPETCRALLNLITAVSPVRLNSERMLDQMATSMGVRRSRLNEMLGVLEQGGVLIRRGYTLRVTPDVLGDHVLSRACLTSGGGATGYAEEIWESFSGLCPSEVLRNLAELDWRTRSVSDQPAELLEGIWNDIEGQFRVADHRGREFILGILEESAYFQANRVLELVEVAVNNPARDGEAKGDQLYKVGHEDVLREVPKLLRRISFVLQHLPRCCDLLWQIGRDDDRALNQFPDHAIRVLQDLASFEPGKPLEFNQIVIDAAARWLASPSANDALYSPIDVMEPMLAKVGHTTQTRGHKFVFLPFLVHEKNTRTLRIKVLETLQQAVGSSDLRVNLRAIKALGEALRDPAPIFNVTISDEFRRSWYPAQRSVLDVMFRIVEDTDEPLVQLEVASLVRWQAKNGSTKGIRDRAQAIVSAVPDTFEIRLTKLLKTSWDHDWEPLPGEDSSVTYRRHEAEQTELRSLIARQFRAKHKNAKSGVEDLGKRLSKIGQASGRAEASRFVQTLADLDPLYAGEVCECLMRLPASALTPYFPYFLASFRRTERRAALRLARRAVKGDSRDLQLAVAQSYTWDGWAAEASRAELKLIEDMLGMNDASLKGAALGAVGSLGRERPRAAIGMIVRSDLGSSTYVANQLATILEPGLGISRDRLSDADVDQVLSKFEVADEIDDHAVLDFLEFAAVRRGRSLVKMLLSRIDRSESEQGSGMTAVPHLGFGKTLKAISASTNYREVLKEIRDHKPKGPSSEVFWLPTLYRDASNGLDAIGIEVLGELLPALSAETLDRIGTLVRGSGQRVVFENVQFVERVLADAHSLGQETYESLASTLRGAAVSGSYSGTPGQPMPRDVEMLEKSSSLADQLPTGSPGQRFYKELADSVRHQIRDGLARDDELIA